jgi:cephalosporin hydroxylase
LKHSLKDLLQSSLGNGNNLATAVEEYFSEIEQGDHIDYENNPIQFQIDNTIEHKLFITAAPDGYLK